MLKKILVLAVAGAAVGSTAAHAGAMGLRDAYTDGGKAAVADVYVAATKSSKFDVYSDGTRATDRRDAYTGGARVSSRDGLIEDGPQE